MARSMDEWNDIRRQVQDRDGNKCVKCGSKEKTLHTHHIQPRSIGGSDDVDNLITLCSRCHRTYEPSQKGIPKPKTVVVKDGCIVCESIASNPKRFSQSIKTTIPELIAKTMGLQAGDKLNYQVVVGGEDGISVSVKKGRKDDD